MTLRQLYQKSEISRNYESFINFLGLEIGIEIKSNEDFERVEKLFNDRLNGKIKEED